MKVKLFSLVLLGLGFSLAQSPDFVAMLQLIDERSNFQSDLSASVSLTSNDPEEGTENSVIQFFRRDADESFLLLIQKPENQLGQGYLNIEDGLWFYDPESRQFSYTSLAENFQGSDARNDDFNSSSLSTDYQVSSYEEGTLGKYEVFILDLEALNDEVVYPFKRMWVTKDNSLVLKSEDYSLTKRLLRTSYYPSYAKVDNSFIADKIIFVDALVEGRKTEIAISNISTAAIPDYVFTKAYVERVNR
ncbi:MAG: outer membrane lipoprotein-sorting protein [Deinococcales bacterium]